MRCLRLPSGAGLALGLMVCAWASLQADDKKSTAEMIVGSWQMVTGSSIHVPAGATIIVTFDKDGKVTAKSSFMGQQVSRSGTYQVDGKKLLAKMEGDKEDTDTIKTLDAKKLILVDSKGTESEYKRVK
jgi:uncharacterized protein (TIGR03066 family)